MWETRVRSLGREVPWRRKWQSTLVLLPGKSHGQRSLIGYSPWGRKESDMMSDLHRNTVSPYQALTTLSIIIFLDIYSNELKTSVQLLSHVWLFVTPWNAACQASLSITSSQSLLKLMSIESVMSSNHLILCCPLLLLPSIFPSIRVFSNKSVLPIRWTKYWSFSFSISPSNEYSGVISFRMDWLDVLAVQGTQESSPTPQFKSMSSSMLSFLHSPALTSNHDHWKNHSLD